MRRASCRGCAPTDPTRPIGEALLDQRILAGIGNIWKAEGCWEAGIDPWRPVGSLSDEEAVALVEGIRPRMLGRARRATRAVRARSTGTPAGPARAAARRSSRAARATQNRTTYWCPGCQIIESSVVTKRAFVT